MYYHKKNRYQACVIQRWLSDSFAYTGVGDRGWCLVGLKVTSQVAVNLVDLDRQYSNKLLMQGDYKHQ